MVEPLPSIYTYVIEHDLGFAPNPFHGTCTLACCKPLIRKHAKEGDYVIGTAAADTKKRGHMTYWMRISKIITFDDYWKDPKFLAKRPDMWAGRMYRYGDNIYHPDAATGKYRAVDSFHSEERGGVSPANLKRDTGTTTRVLLGDAFAYWGIDGPKIPRPLDDFIVATQGHKCRFAAERVMAFLAWLNTVPGRGLLGRPAHWRIANNRR
jgi:hypothetical protein